MLKEKRFIGNIPAILWGEKSEQLYIFVHGKMSKKEEAEPFAELAASKGWQTISFDLPEHGERIGKSYPCSLKNGIADLTQIGDYVFTHWQTVSLFGCSLGAFFSLHAYQNRQFQNCLFQSPIVNMEYLIEQMFVWFHVTKEELKVKQEIQTPIDTLSWPYYLYVKEHPIQKWTPPTHILYAAKDTLQTREVIQTFADKFNCCLTVAENSEHPFMAEHDKPIVQAWIKNSL